MAAPLSIKALQKYNEFRPVRWFFNEIGHFFNEIYHFFNEQKKKPVTGTGCVQNNEKNGARRARSDRGARLLVGGGEVCANGLRYAHFTINYGFLKFNRRDKGLIIRRVDILHLGFHAL